MSEATTAAPRFTVELRSNRSSVVVASVAYDEPSQALQAYRDASEAFRAAKMPAGSSLSLSDQKLELHGGAVSEGLGVIRHSWSKDAAREQFDQLAPSKDERPEQAALRAAFAGKVAESAKPEPMQIDPADLQRVAAARERDSAQARESLGDKAAGEQQRGGTIEGLERTAQRDAPGQDPTGKKSSPAENEEREDSLRKRYLKTAEGYHDKQTLELVIQDKGSRLTSTREDMATVDAIATAAIDRGWVSVGVSGTENFKREAWYQLSVRGVEVTGYTPNAADKERLSDGLKAITPVGMNTVEKGRSVNVGYGTPGYDGWEKHTGKTAGERQVGSIEGVERAAGAENKAQNKEQAGPAKSSAEPPMRSPVEEASKAVRLVASDMAVEGGSSTPREQLAVSAAANAAYGAAVAANERDAKTARAADKTTGVSAPVPATPVRAAEPRLSSEQQVMVAAVDRALRDGGMSQEQRDRVSAVVRQNLAEKNPSVQIPKVADRAAIPQPAAAPAPQKQPRRELSR